MRKRSVPKLRLFMLFAIVSINVICLNASSAAAFGVLVTNNQDSTILATRTFITRSRDGKVLQLSEIDYNRGTGNSFLWLLPVRTADSVTVQTCRDDSAFDDLAEISEPRILIRHREFENIGGGCGGNMTQQIVESDIWLHEYSGNVAENPEVQPLEPFEGFGEFEEWLSQAGFSVPAAAREELRHYVDHSYHFVATQVNGGLSTGSICLELTYDPSSILRDYDYLLPLRTVDPSTVDSMEVLVYALDEARVRPYVDPTTMLSSYFTAEINLHELRVLGDNETNYQTLFTTASQKTDPPAFIVEFSDELETIPQWIDSDLNWLTRFRVRLAPAETINTDLALEVAGNERVGRNYQIVVAALHRSPSLPIALCAFAMVAGALVLRRKSRKGMIFTLLFALIPVPTLASQLEQRKLLEIGEGSHTLVRCADEARDGQAVDDEQSWSCP